jgi:ion channel-forming bestrophin family protein
MIDYDPHTWRKTFFAVRGSMLKIIAFRSAMVVLAATPVSLFHAFVRPFHFENALSAHTLVGTALGLLLVFRTNQSYDRWWEGRKLWGAMVNTCRNVTRACSVHLANQPDRLNQVLSLTRAFPGAVAATLRQERFEPVGLALDDAQAVAARVHRPSAICQRLTHHLELERRTGRLSDIIFTTLDSNVQTLVDIVGACERIHKTPLPFAYVVHLRRALVVYCVSLPFVLLQSFGWASLAIVFAVTYILLGIEEIGVEIEDPFDGDENDLPLERITATIVAHVDDHLGVRVMK